VLGEGPAHLLQPAGVDHVVGVAEQQHLATGDRGGGVAGGSGTDLGGGVEHAQVGQGVGMGAGDLRRAVLRAVVGDQHLPPAVGALRGEGVELSGQGAGGVTGGDHHRDVERCGGSHGSP
jgi:hypothetical protein